MIAEKAKAITLWQPWAQCVAKKVKLWETRSWFTKYRGVLLIHSAQRKVDKKGMIAFHRAMGNNSELVPQLVEIFDKAHNDSFPRGYIVAATNLINCFLMVERYDQYAWKELSSEEIFSHSVCSSKEELFEKSGVDEPMRGFLAVPVGIDKKGNLREAIAITEQTKQERLLGNWFPGNFAWQLENIVQLQEPIKCKGQQGLWTPQSQVLQQLEDKVRATN